MEDINRLKGIILELLKDMKKAMEDYDWDYCKEKNQEFGRAMKKIKELKQITTTESLPPELARDIIIAMIQQKEHMRQTEIPKLAERARELFPESEKELQKKMGEAVKWLRDLR